MNVKKMKVIPCEWGDSLGRHRWKDRETHHRMDDGRYVIDKWCLLCGKWMVDCLEEVK